MEHLRQLRDQFVQNSFHKHIMSGALNENKWETGNLNRLNETEQDPSGLSWVYELPHPCVSCLLK